MSGGDVTINLLEVARTAHRQAVEISGRAVMRFGLTPVSRTLEQPRQPKMGLGEVGLIGQDCSVRLSGASGVILFTGAHLEETTGERLALGPRRGGRQSRAVGLEAGVVARRDQKHSQRARPLAMSDDRFQAAAEVVL